MQRITIAVLVGLPIALVIAWRLGGSLGTGVLLGFTLGAAMGGFGLAWQTHVLRTKPEAALSASMLSFLFKLAVVLMGGLVFKFVEPAAARVDYRSFLVAFAASAVLLLLAGIPDAARALKGQKTLQGQQSP